MPLPTSSYSGTPKIFTSKYVDDSDDEDDTTNFKSSYSTRPATSSYLRPSGLGQSSYTNGLGSYGSGITSSYGGSSLYRSSHSPFSSSSYSYNYPETSRSPSSSSGTNIPTSSTYSTAKSSSPYSSSYSSTYNAPKSFTSALSSSVLDEEPNSSTVYKPSTANIPTSSTYSTARSSSYSSTYNPPKSFTSALSSTVLDEEPTSPMVYKPLSRLPPPIPTSQRRVTPIRRASSSFDESIPDKIARRSPMTFQTRPLKNLTVVSRSLTPVRAASARSESPSLSNSVSLRGGQSPTPGPRRIFPQTGASANLEDLREKDEAPVVFDANLTFVLGCKGKLRQNFKPVPAFLEDTTASSCLTSKIADFLKRTDHVMDEWKSMGHRDDRDDTRSSSLHRVGDRMILGRSRSATNIMIKGFQYFSRSNSCRSSVARDMSEDRTEADELSEMTADLAEEHSTSTLAAERLDAETADRARLERELSESQQKNKDLRNSSERLEMELLYARSDLNGISEDDEDGDGEAVYKQRYERVVRELEFTKRRLQQQHEDDLEQLVGLKKQLEKKLTDAYEEVEEQRQVVGQWKRKVQKLNGEMNDLKLLLEEQNSRNNLLEKKQRKFDSEIQLLQDEFKKEKQAKDRLGREKEVVIAEKYTLESSVADLRMEVDLKEEKLLLLQREFDEVTYGGKTEEEVTILRKQKIDCERRLHDQEEELDELAGQVQLLEQAKLKLEMSLEQQRKTSKKEAQQHDEELEEVRCNTQKKVKALEAQLENEHEERTILLREKHELERRLTAALENDRSEKACDEAVLHRLKRDLKRTKALLRDTQAQLERQKAENPSKVLIRQLRNQIEDSECARSIAVKAKQTIEAELSETQAFLEETTRVKNDAEEKANLVSREKADLQTQVEENEEELAEVLKKYKTTVQQMSLDQIALQEQVSLVSELETERNSLKEQLVELTSKLESVESMGDVSSNLLVKRTEIKVKELESKLDLEQTTRTRLEVQISRLKEAVEKLQNDLSASRTKEQQAQDQIRKLQRSLRELRDEHNSALTKESESMLKRKELEKRYEALDAESSTVRTDLRLALKRIEDLQAVIQNELEDSTENSDSDHDSYSSDDSVNTFLVNHKLSASKSSSMTFEGQRRLSNTSRSSTSSNLTKESSYA